MKILSILFSLVSLASPSSEIVKTVLEKQTDCQNFVRRDDQNIYLGFGSYKKGFEEPRFPIPAHITVAPLSGDAFDLNTADAAIDALSVGNSLFVLTYSRLEEWDLGARKKLAEYPTFFFGTEPLEYKQHAKAMARFGKKLILAHGRLGITIFDLEKKKITNQISLLRRQLPLESMATGVAVVGKFAYVVVDSFHLAPPNAKPPFQGVVVVDLESEKVVKEMEGLDPGADGILVEGDRIVVSYMGIPLWKYSSRQFLEKNLPLPELTISKFPVNGHPTGYAFMDDTYFYTCFVRWPDKPGDKLYKFPLAIDRKEARLD